MKCPQCGGEFPADTDCRSWFDLCLAKEYEYPAAYGAAHHLTVTSYMLQHNEYSRAGWLAARKLLDQFIHHGLAPATARRQNRRQVDSGNRKWSITKGEKIPQVDKVKWTRTIADVRIDSVENYCADVKLWAESILADTEDLIKN